MNSQQKKLPQSPILQGFAITNITRPNYVNMQMMIGGLNITYNRQLTVVWHRKEIRVNKIVKRYSKRSETRRHINELILSINTKLRDGYNI